MKILNFFLAGLAMAEEKKKEERPEMTKVDYKKVYIENPLDVMPTKRENGWTENKHLVEQNKRWLKVHDEGKEVVKTMINIKNTIPLTPHGQFRFVDGSDYCWVFYPYDSDEDELGPIQEFATHLSEYFYERCAVATIDLAYPANRFTFGYLIDDTPMLFVKKAGADITMLNEFFEQGSFSLKDWTQWGFRVSTDSLEDDFDGELKKILDKVYEPQHEFQKVNSIYMEWYGRGDEELYKEKSAGNKLMVEHIQRHAVETNEKGESVQMKLSKADAFAWFRDNTEFLFEDLKHYGHRMEPSPLPDVKTMFKKFKDEL